MVNLFSNLLVACLFAPYTLAAPITSVEPYNDISNVLPRFKWSDVTTALKGGKKNCMANTIYVYQCVAKGQTATQTHLPMKLTQSKIGKDCNGGDGAGWTDSGGVPYENKPSNMGTEGCKAGQTRLESAVDFYRWRNSCGDFEKYAKSIVAEDKSIKWWYNYEGDKNVKCTV